MNKERNCQKCIHHISGLCSKWDCEMQTLEDYRNKAIDEFVERINEHVFEEKTEEQYSNSVSFMREIKQIAEQMKAGGTDG